MTILNLDDFSSSLPIPISNVNNSYNLDDVSLCDENEEYFYLEVLDSFSGTTVPQFYLVTNPDDVWYTRENDNYSFEVVISQPNSTIEETVKIVYTQDLVLNQIIQGTQEDGLVVVDAVGEILELLSGESYEFLFSEIGPLNQDGNPEIIQGSFEGEVIPGIPGITLKGSYRLKPI